MRHVNLSLQVAAYTWIDHGEESHWDPHKRHTVHPIRTYAGESLPNKEQTLKRVQIAAVYAIWPLLGNALGQARHCI